MRHLSTKTVHLQGVHLPVNDSVLYYYCNYIFKLKIFYYTTGDFLSPLGKTFEGGNKNN